MLEDLGGTLLEVMCGDAEGRSEIGGVIIYDPFDEPIWPEHALILGVGLNDPTEIAELIIDLGTRDCAGLVLRAPVDLTRELAIASARSGIAVLGLTRSASWAHLAAMLRSVLLQDNFTGAGETLAGVPSGDLFAVANAVAALLDAPVTIEDRNSRVLAFSAGQDEADGARVATILGRRVSEQTTRQLQEQGVFRQLNRTHEPLFLKPSERVSKGFTQPRVALAIRAGDEVLGSIWAAVHEPLDDHQMQTFADVGKLVALHLLSHRAGADVERRLRADLVGTALEGGPAANDAVSQLGLSRRPAVVLALALGNNSENSPTSHVDRIAERERVADAFAMHLAAARAGSAVALLGDVAYAIVPVVGPLPRAERDAETLALGFVERMEKRTDASIGIGTIAVDSLQLQRSRDGADRALRVIASAHHVKRTACISDVGVDSLLLELADLFSVRGDGPTGPVSRLLAYDKEHSAFLVASLQAWLDAFGNINVASKAVHVHPNTFRYRLRRVTEVSGLDLNDADARFAAMLQLRMFTQR